MKRKICIVTGTRAEYGLLYWILKGIHKDADLRLQLIVTGTHLSQEFGLTVKEIEKDKFPIAERVEMLLSSDTEIAIATSMGLGMVGFAKAYESTKPDIILVLGDRFEMLAAVSAAVPFRIPVAHIGGGETTEGSMDEYFRHAITKMSYFHFPAILQYADRIIQMGEDSSRVFCCGAPGLDNIYKTKLMSKRGLFDDLKLPLNRKKIGVVTYHPDTLRKDSVKEQIIILLRVLKSFVDIYWIFTMPNADTGGRVVKEKVEMFVRDNPERGKAFASLGRVRYLSLMKYANIMVGNSSSGIVETPSFELPVVNIGDRQKGRVRARNIIDVHKWKPKMIANAIKTAISSDFRLSIKGIKNPYGDGDSSKKIVSLLKKLPLDKTLSKKFCDLSL
ncbi:MAG: UDP-N-acetylglucosamine 2-epimerase (hydrolyzing) [Candidatus Scalindua sp.]|jgi:UDP-hydrolysing UDP-N-acetyl-D-glucosamine 2-epimerase|nr:UDP-N-acetylglucosamine 2-epimerase (hydrolyzing) [Candidatus Scalindua sp.]